MYRGNRLILIFILFFVSNGFLLAEEKVTSNPLINLDELTPSFEELEGENENISSSQSLKKKKNTY